MILDEKDLLNFQLYIASKSPRIRRARVRGWILSTLMLVGLAYLFYESGNEFLGHYFLVTAAFCLVLFPLYSRWRYKNHYLRYIRDTYKNRLGEKSELEFTNDTIVTRDRTTEVRINKSDVEEINEIRDYYFLKTSSGNSLIVSKQKTEAPEKIEKEMRALAETGCPIQRRTGMEVEVVSHK